MLRPSTGCRPRSGKKSQVISEPPMRSALSPPETLRLVAAAAAMLSKTSLCCFQLK
jgi:hypothetical protein